MKRVVPILILAFTVTVWGWAGGKAMVLYYSFDEGGGNTVRDESGNGNDGELKNNPRWVDGKFGGGLQFEGGSYVEIPASNSLHGNIFKEGQFTVCAWIKPTLSGDQWQHIWRSVAQSGTQDTLFLNVDGRLSWRGRVGGSWTVLCETDPGLISTEDWFHVAVVGDKSKFKIYLNGELKKETEFQETDGEIETFFLAFDNRRWQERYSGVMDEVCVFAESLSEDEIKSLMEGVKKFLPVQIKGKLAVTWGDLKRL